MRKNKVMITYSFSIVFVGVSTQHSPLLLANHVNSSRKANNWSIFGMGGVGVDKLFFL